MALEAEPVVPDEGDDEGHQPAADVREQGPAAPALDQRHDDGPMHQRGPAADGDEPGWPAGVRQGGSKGVAGMHGGLQPRPRRAICIAADDYGLHAGVNEAVVRLAAQGRVQAVGCLVGAPAFAAGRSALRRIDPARVDVGLHLDLTEWPLRQGPALGLAALILDGPLRRPDRAALRGEIHAQLDAFEQALGRHPAYVDGHRHVHQLAAVRQELLTAVVSRYAAGSVWLRSTRRPLPLDTVGARPCLEGLSACMPRPARPGTVRWQSRGKAWLIERLGAHALAEAAWAAGCPQNRHLLGVYGFRGGRRAYVGLMAGWLSAAEQGDLLMCHPALPGPPAAQAPDPIRPARAVEFSVLSSAQFGAMLLAAAVDLRPMSALLGCGPQRASWL